MDTIDLMHIAQASNKSSEIIGLLNLCVNNIKFKPAEDHWFEFKNGNIHIGNKFIKEASQKLAKGFDYPSQNAISIVEEIPTIITMYLLKHGVRAIELGDVSPQNLTLASSLTAKAQLDEEDYRELKPLEYETVARALPDHEANSSSPEISELADKLHEMYEESNIADLTEITTSLTPDQFQESMSLIRGNPPGTGTSNEEIEASKEDYWLNIKSLKNFLNPKDSPKIRINRRFLNYRNLLPVETRKLVNSQYKLRLAVDKSGSFLDDLPKVLKFIILAAKAYGIENVEVWAFDSDYEGPWEYSTKNLNSLKIPNAGGGTNPNPLFLRLKEEDKNQHCKTIVISDGYFDCTVEMPNTMLVVTDSNTNFNQHHKYFTEVKYLDWQTL